MIRSHVRLVLAALALTCAAADAAAQDLTFHGLSWGAPAHEVSERIRAAGYPLRGVDQWGDYVFGAPEGGSLVAWMSPAGLVAVELEWENEPGRFPARFARMADSLRNLYGTPSNQHETMNSWLRREGSVMLALDTRLDSTLLLYYSGFDKTDEIYRRDSLMTLMRQNADSVGEGAWQSLAYADMREVFVDSTRFVVLGSRTYGARMRYRWALPERLDNGLLYDAQVVDVELDCAAGRSRVLRAIPLYHGVATPAMDTPQAGRRWLQPPAGSLEAQAVQGACEVLVRQPR